MLNQLIALLLALFSFLTTAFGNGGFFMDKIQQNYINVRSDFGAYGDGLHDDTASIQNALDSLKENGGIIKFPTGTYLISSCIIFYSNQNLKFEGGAILKRKPLKNGEEPKELRYLMASYTSPDNSFSGYNGVHDVKIDGATFDGNENINTDSKITLLNLCHTKNVKITNCSFINGSVWHCIEINSSTNTKVSGCTFDGNSYTVIRNGVNELLQIDAAKGGLYGPVFWQNGSEMEFVQDETVCTDIEIADNLFICNNFAAIGNHTNYPHNNIRIHDNTFIGKPDSRGYLAFMNAAYNIDEFDNSFNS